MLLSLLSAIGSTAPGPVPTPGLYIAGGNRNEVPYTRTTFSTPSDPKNHVRQQSIHVRSPENCILRNPLVDFSSWYANANGGESSTNLNPFKLRAALEYPLGTRYRLYFPGDLIEQLMSVSDGGMDVEAYLDPLLGNFDIPPATSYWIRLYENFLNVDETPYTGTSYNALMNQLLAPGRNECNMAGSDPNDDRTVVGNMTAVSGVSQSYGFTMIRGIGVTP